MRLWPALALLILLGSSFAQSIRGEPSEDYVVRLERITPGEDTCLLLRTDRKYRLEEVRGGHTAVFDAELSDAALAEVEQQLNTGGLSGLTQDEIPAPIIPSRREVVALSIPHNKAWRNLEFHAPESWDAVKEPVERLLKLLKRLHKTSGPALGKEKANRCLPSGSVSGEVRGPFGATAEGAGGDLMRNPPVWPSRDTAPPKFLVRLGED